MNKPIFIISGTVLLGIFAAACTEKGPDVSGGGR